MRIEIALALGLALTTGACVTSDNSSDDDSGDGKSDGTGGSFIGYIQSNSPFYWASSDYATFVASEAALGMPANPTPIETTDALTTRLQGWVDKIDAVVRDEVERTSGSALVAPKPIVEILPSSNTFNAWVSPTIACTGVSVLGADPANMTQTFLMSTNVQDGVVAACARPAYPGAVELQTFWNRHKPACNVNPDLSVSGTGCTLQVDGPSGELSLISTSPYIHVTSDLIAAVDERTLVVVLAHELGHYYRAHVTDATLQKYNFWYDTEVDRKKVPVPAANATDLQAKYAEIVNGPKTIQADVPGHYSPRFRVFLLTSIAPLLAERTEPGFVCSAARDALGPWMSSLLTGFGIPTDAMTSYLDFETKLVACATQLNLTGDPGADALSYGTVLMAVINAKLPPTTFPFRATLSQVLDPLNAKAQKLDQKEVALLQQVQQNRIGLYTVEEEADDIALEISSKLGISPDEVLASWQAFMGAVAQSVPEAYRAQYEQENTSCKALLDASFTTKDASGKTIAAFVPIGDLSEPHHSDCYRLFNFWREQKLRKYTVTTPLVFPDDWATMQAEARTLSGR